MAGHAAELGFHEFGQDISTVDATSLFVEAPECTAQVVADDGESWRRHWRLCCRYQAPWACCHFMQKTWLGPVATPLLQDVGCVCVYSLPMAARHKQASIPVFLELGEFALNWYRFGLLERVHDQWMGWAVTGAAPFDIGAAKRSPFEFDMDGELPNAESPGCWLHPLMQHQPQRHLQQSLVFLF